MIKRTNLALGVGVALYFLPHVNQGIYFVPAVILSSLVPDLGLIIANKSSMGKNPRRITFFGKILRSYLTCITLALILTFIYPIFALPVFLGYSFTLSLNSFTKEGIQPFWPASKKSTHGPITTGGTIDTTLFYIFILFDIALLIKFFL